MQLFAALLELKVWAILDYILRLGPIINTFWFSNDRQKVDLTKYIEEHDFNFDNVFDSDADNQRVSL